MSENKISKAISKLFQRPPQKKDALILSIFSILVTFNPLFMHGRINFFEVGLYLPGIQAVLAGEVPYRDFFHLRGPLELYIPALMMKFLGIHLSVMYLYFYIGNVLCLIFIVMIAQEIIKSRLILYAMIPVIIGRTWPRIVFAFWGGMRYALGLLSLWLMIKFIKSNKTYWLGWAGVATSCASLISVEIGVYSFFGIIAVLCSSWFFKLQDQRIILNGFSKYLIGIYWCLVTSRTSTTRRCR